MPWLRLDERFATHPKLAALSDRDFRVWVRVLLYCATHRTSGKLPASSEVTGLDEATRKRFRSLKLLDHRRGVDNVHDWLEYNPPDPTAAERARRYRVTQASRKTSRSKRDEDRDADRDESVTSRARQRGRYRTEPIPKELKSEVQNHRPTETVKLDTLRGATGAPEEIDRISEAAYAELARLHAASGESP